MWPASRPPLWAVSPMACNMVPIQIAVPCSVRLPAPPFALGATALATSTEYLVDWAREPMAPLDAASAAALLEKQRYDPQILPQLEAYVRAQCDGRTYDLDANLATLKLYQFHPEKANQDVICKILVKALMNLPNTDYLLCTYLVSESVQELELVTSISTVASLLEACSFRAVWGSLEPIGGLLASIPGFDDAIRSFMLGVLQITYQAVPLKHVLESLGLTDTAALMKLVEGKGWKIDGDMVRISLNDDNTAKPKKVDVSGAMGYDQMTKILSSISS